MAQNTHPLPNLRLVGGWQDDNHAPAIVIVEHRDEVFARLATDLAEIGLCVHRASSVAEAIRLCIRRTPRLVVVNLELPHSRGWRLLDPLCFFKPTFHVWVYKARRSVSDCTMARAYRVDEVIDYRGDLLELADAVMNCLTGPPNRRPRYNIATDSYAVEAAA